MRRNNFKFNRDNKKELRAVKKEMELQKYLLLLS